MSGSRHSDSPKSKKQLLNTATVILIIQINS